MSEEEQEAIEYLKEDIELYEDCCYLNTEDHMKSIETLLNYISKLQKENEELKELNNAGVEKIKKLEKENYEYFKQSEELKEQLKAFTGIEIY